MTGDLMPDRGSWWSIVFSSAVESTAFTDMSQLDAGRSLARRGQLGAVEIEPGSARVGPAEHDGVTDPDDHSDRRPTSRRGWLAQLGVRSLSEASWLRLIDELATRPAVAAQLLTGVVPAEVSSIADSVKASLALGAGDLAPDCSCPDWHEPCKHVFALCAQLTEMIEADPWLFFLLRGMDRQRFLDALRHQRATRAGTTDASSHEPRGTDPGVPAAAAHRSTPAFIPPPHRRRPLVPGRPVSLAVPPPADSGLLDRDLHLLVSDAARRALALLTDHSPSGLTLDPAIDAVRLAATDPSLSPRFERMLGIDADELERATIAWNIGGAAGLAIAETSVGTGPASPPPDRAIDPSTVPERSVVRGNRVSLPAAEYTNAEYTNAEYTNAEHTNTPQEAAAQLRRDNDDLWWRFEADAALGWILVDGPFRTIEEAIA